MVSLSMQTSPLDQTSLCHLHLRTDPLVSTQKPTHRPTSVHAETNYDYES